MAEQKFPSEVIDLPSEGKLYPKESPLSSGKVEIKYMTAKEEDILTNQAYIQSGTVLDKLLASLIFSKNLTSTLSLSKKIISLFHSPFLLKKFKFEPLLSRMTLTI